ncbi:MAG: hypothetical protein ABI467_03735 [Kofleriaceae bacterium]
MFLILMVVGLAGLAVMALPALGRHGTVGHGAHALHAGHVANAGKALVHSRATAITRYVPSPRLVLSMLALYGAFGNVFVAAHLPAWSAALLAIVPAALVERFAITPIWRSLFRLELQASGPLGEIVMSEATAVTPFRSGRGVVSVVREGRLVQFSARLIEADANLPVRVGDRLRIEDVEGARERVTVSVVGGSA